MRCLHGFRIVPEEELKGLLANTAMLNSLIKDLLEQKVTFTRTEDEYIAKELEVSINEVKADLYDFYSIAEKEIERFEYIEK